MSLHRCTGTCCAEFCIGFSRIADIEQRARDFPDGEAAVILPMLIVIENREDHDRFTCRYWNPFTRLCTNYENRPYMCSAYPYGDVCYHCGYTLALVKVGDAGDPNTGVI